MTPRQQSAAAAGLRQLRWRLTWLNFILCVLVLLGMGLALLSMAERQLENAAWRQLNGSLDSVTAYVVNQKVISNNWLVRQEMSSHSIIGVEDGGQPFLFHGAFVPATDRSLLLERARSEAARRGLDLAVRPSTLEGEQRTTFQVKGEHGKIYYTGVALLPSARSWQSVVVMQSNEADALRIAQLRFTFGALFLVGGALLLALSWWLSGRAARPIADSMRRQNEFIAAASHELKSPLAVISTSVAVLGEAPERDTALRQTISRECLRMGRLVSDLLTLARSENGGWSVHLTTLNPETLLGELAEKFLPLTAQKGQHLCLDLPEDPLPDVTGDAQRLEQLLTILLDNACAYTQPGGTITLAAATGRKKLLLYVKDDGPGIAAKDRAHIFERFYRADSSRQSKEHSGLGLSIAQELAHLHGGRLYLEDQSGYSTVFVLELPLP